MHKGQSLKHMNKSSEFADVNNTEALTMETL